MTAPAIVHPGRAADTEKLECLFWCSGTMANLEGRLNYVARMAADELDAAGRVLGRQVEIAVTNPAWDWPTYAQMGRQLLQEQKVAALLGCGTSVSGKSALPVVEQNEGLLFYRLHFEGKKTPKMSFT